MKSLKDNIPLEKIEQENFVNYCNQRNIICCCIPNGVAVRGKNKFAYINSLKKTGYRVGIPDLFILAKNKSKTKDILFIEMKRQKGGTVRTEQKEWLGWLNENGYPAYIAKGCDEAITILNDYLVS